MPQIAGPETTRLKVSLGLRDAKRDRLAIGGRQIIKKNLHRPVVVLLYAAFLCCAVSSARSSMFAESRPDRALVIPNQRPSPSRSDSGLCGSCLYINAADGAAAGRLREWPHSHTLITWESAALTTKSPAMSYATALSQLSQSAYDRGEKPIFLS